jgi:hypothetical protein
MSKRDVSLGFPIYGLAACILCNDVSLSMFEGFVYCSSIIAVKSPLVSRVRQTLGPVY